MATFPSIEVFQAFADYARPITDAEWGSMRQTEAQNTFFNFAEQWFPLQFRDGGKFSNYALKATTEEMLDYALEIIRKHHPSGTPPVAARPDATTVVAAERPARTWQTEFPEMPADSMPEIPEGFVDESWHNDDCPCFWSEARGLRLWIDLPDPAQREYAERERFALFAGEYGHPDQIEVLRTENWSDVLKALEQDDEQAAPVVAAPARKSDSSLTYFEASRDLQVGMVVRSTDWLEAYPNYMIEPGARFVVVQQNLNEMHTLLAIRLIPEDKAKQTAGDLGEWNDEVHFYGPEMEGFTDDADGLDASDPGSAWQKGTLALEIMPDDALPVAERLAAVFASFLLADMSEDQKREIVERNKTASPGVCHSHDFCDANMVMAPAFEAMGLPAPHTYADLDEQAAEYPALQASCALWNEAWDIAKARYFAVGRDGQ